MKINKDIAATIVGCAGAAAFAAQPVMSAVSGSFNRGDWFQLAWAIYSAVQGYLTNKQSK